MKAKSVIKSILRTMVLAGLICMLPVFLNNVQAADVEICKENGETVTYGVDYEIANDYGHNVVKLYKSGLIIVNSNYAVKDCCEDTSEHVYTIKGNIQVSDSGVTALQLNSARSVTLYVDGNCNITSGDDAGGITTNGPLTILPKKGGDSLTINSKVTGINLANTENGSNLSIGDGVSKLNVNINSQKEAMLGSNEGPYGGPLTVCKGATLECTGGKNCDTNRFIDNVHGINIYGKFVAKIEQANTTGRGCVALHHSIDIGPEADILIVSRDKCAVANQTKSRLDEKSLGMRVIGSKVATENLSQMTKAVIPERGLDDSGQSSYSRMGAGAFSDPFAKSIAIGPLGKNDSKTGKLRYLLSLLNREEVEDEKVEIIDRDTFKSEYPSGTVFTKNTLEGEIIFDMKAHLADAKTISNQELLVQSLVGADTSVLLTENIYPRRDLSIDENGLIQILVWKNLPKNQAGPVSAVVYNQTDGAYVINGYLDAEGTATFTGFKLRIASTVTICK